LALACAIYAFFYALELSSTELNIVLIWSKLQYLGISFIAPAFLFFALKYTGRVKKFTFPWLLALLVIPIITFVLNLTNEYHGLIYRSSYLDLSGPFPILTFERGIWYWFHIVNISFSVILSNILFLLMWFGSKRNIRKQIAIIFIGSLLPWLGFIVYLTRAISINIDITAFILPLSAICFYYGLVRYRLFDIIPVARDLLFEALPDGALVFDLRLRLVDFNAAAKELFNLDEESIGKNLSELKRSWPKLLQNLQKPVEKYLSFELQEETSEKDHWFRADIIPLAEDINNLQGQMVIIKDITDQRFAEENLRLMATTDYLTGLRNRRFFTQITEKELKRSMRYKIPLSIITIDLDHFKKINDAYGHSGGDRVLIAFAELLKKRLRELDTAARLGGEEFSILLPDTAVEKALYLAEELRKTVESSKVRHDGALISYTISIGVATYHADIISVDGLLIEADRALYQAKENGRNCVVVAKPA